MIDGRKVIAWTPYGRERTVSILATYVLRDIDLGLIDEWWLCMNTGPEQRDDIQYAKHLADVFPREIKLVARPSGVRIHAQKQRNTGYFYRDMIDPDAIYLRLDDDIVYVHEDAVERLVRHRIEHPQGVASFPVMWNNAVVSWFAQQTGAIPAAGTRRGGGSADLEYVWPKVGGPYCMDPVGWADGRFAVAMHRLLLDRLERGAVEECLLYQDYQLPLGLQFSVSTFTSSGRTYADLEVPGVLVPDEEENWHTVHQPLVLGVPNVLVGNALVSHYTFFPQGPIVNATGILDQYRAIAPSLNHY